VLFFYFVPDTTRDSLEFLPFIKYHFGATKLYAFTLVYPSYLSTRMPIADKWF
jgi:hypothetical protein